jgi:exodeoxyribonuclease-3
MQHTIVSFNVNGIRAINKKTQVPAHAQQLPVITAIAEEQQADIICLQEIKTNSAADLDIYRAHFPHIHCRFSDARKGYSGVAILSKIEPLSVSCPKIGCQAADEEGRILVAEYDTYCLVNCYTPNSKTGLARLEERLKWDEAFSIYLQDLRRTTQKHLIVVGDLNCAHNEIDICRPATNRRSPGFSPQERDSFTCLLGEVDLIDTFRHLHPRQVKYSWWSPITRARDRDAGWRIDYILASSSLADKIAVADILNEYFGSDHCPVIVRVTVS